MIGVNDGLVDPGIPSDVPIEAEFERSVADSFRLS